MKTLLLFLFVGLTIVGRATDINVGVSYSITLVNDSTSEYKSASRSGGCVDPTLNVPGYGDVQPFGVDIAPGSSVTEDSGGATSYIGVFPSGATVTVVLAVGGSGPTIYSGPIDWDGHSSGGSVHVSQILYVDGSTCQITNAPPPPCLVTNTFSQRNNNPDYRIMAVGHIGPDGVTPVISGYAQTVAPGVLFTLTEVVACSNASQDHLFISAPEGDNLVDTGITGTSTGSSGYGSGSYTNGTGGIGGNGGSQQSQTPSTGVPTTNIVWSAGTTANDSSGVIAAVKDAASVAHDDAVKIGEQAHKDSLNIDNTLTNLQLHITVTNNDTALQASNVWVQNFPTNFGNLTITNFPNTNSIALTNYATESTLQGISNLLSSATNYPSTNAVQAMWNLIPASATNADAATAAANNIFSSTYAEFDSLIEFFTVPPPIIPDPGHTSAWEFEFCGHTIDLDPFDIFPTLSPWSLGLWDFILVAAYLYSLVKVYYDVVKMFGSMQTGGTPNMSVVVGAEVLGTGVEIGGNSIGVILGIVVTFALLTLWFVFLTVLIVPIDEFLGIYSSISSVFTSVASTTSGACAVHVLVNVFPVQLAIRLLTARILIYLTAAKAALVCVASARILLGK